MTILCITNLIHAGKIATLTRVAGGQKTVISWQDAPDDLFYRASPQTKKVGGVFSITGYTVIIFRQGSSSPWQQSGGLRGNHSAGFCKLSVRLGSLVL